MAADLKLVGAVAIKVRPDAKGFRGDTQRQIKKELSGVDGEVEIRADVDTAGMVEKVKRAKDEVERKEINLKVGVDYASIVRTKQRVNQMIRSLDDVSLDVTLDRPGLEKARADLQDMEKDARVIIRYVNDTRGWNEVLARLQDIQREKIVKEVTFATDKVSLESQIAYAKARIRNLGVDLHYTNDRSSVEAAIADVNKRIKDLDEASIHTKLDRSSLEAAELELRAKLNDIPATVRVDFDDQGSLKAVRSRLDAMLSDLRSVDIEVDVTEEGIRRVRERIDDLIHDENGQNIDLDVNLNNTTVTSARLAYIARPRNVPFYATINAKSVAVVEGLLRSLAGINAIKRTGNFLENLISNFDKISISAAGWGTAIGGIANSLVFMTGSLLSIGGGLAQMVGLAALGPTAFGALASSMLIFSAVFKDFGDAVAGDTRALKLLPPAGKEAALAIGGVWAEMRQNLSKRFWDEASDSMLGFAKHALPAFTKGLTTAAGGLGKVFSGVLDSFTNLSITGGLKRMYDNLNQFFEQGAKGATALWDALNTLGLQGTDMLPKFGGWLKDISIQFNNWIQAAAKSGDITRWIENGVRSLQSLWSAAGSTIDIFKALTRAFDIAGHTGLGGFANSMRRVADAMLAEPFQSQLANIFKGANDGASALNVGVRDLGRSFMNSNVFVRDLLTSLGRLGGGLLSDIAKTFSNLKFQTGSESALSGMEDALRILQIGFNDLGTVIGHLGDIAGAVFRGIAPVMNTLTSSLAGSLSVISDNLVQLVPQLMNLFAGLLSNAQGPLTIVIGFLNSLLTLLNSMPTGVSGVVLAFAGMLLLRRQFATFFTAISSGWARMNAEAGNGAATNGWMRNIRNVWANTVSSVNSDARRVNVGPAATTFSRLGQTVGIATRGIAGSIGSAFSSLAGGWIGLAVIAIGTAFAVLGQQAAESKAQIDNLITTLDKVGSVTDATIAENVKKLNDSKINLFTDNPGTKSATETIKQLGKSIEETGAIATKGGTEYDNLIRILDSGKQAVIDSNDLQTGYGITLAKNKDAIQEWATANGIAGDVSSLTADQFMVLKREVEGIHNATGSATTAWSNMNDSMVEATARTDAFDAAMRKLHDTTGDMPGRIRAFKDAMDVLNGKVRSTDEIQKSYNTSVSDMGDFLKSTTDGLDTAAKKQAAWNGVIDVATGKINTVSRAGQNLDSQLQALTGQEIGIVIDMQQRGAKPEEITKELERAKQAWINQATQAGISAPAAGAAWDKMMGALPKEIAIAISTPGIEDAAKKTESFRNVLSTLDGRRVIAQILGDDTDLANKLLVSSNNLDAFDKIIATATADLDPAKADSVRLQLIQRLAEMAATDPTVRAYLDPRILEAERARIVDELNQLDRMTPSPSVNAEVVAALNALAAVNAALASLDGAVATSTVIIQTRNIESWETGAAGGGDRRPTTPRMANGAILDRLGRGLAGFKPAIKAFAAGGIHFENPASAKIYSPASTFRVFAEQSTGGEAFLPLARSKRPRSLAILAEVARRFGKTLGDANQYANGAIAGVAGPSNSSTVNAPVHIGTLITSDPDAAVAKLNQKRRDALAVANIRG